MPPHGNCTNYAARKEAVIGMAGSEGAGIDAALNDGLEDA